MSHSSRRKPLLFLPEISDPQLSAQAFTHRSYRHENPGIADNERLEFLGDAVINFTVGDFLYQYYPNYSEAELTQLRSQLIDEAQLAHFARLLNLGELMRLGKGADKNGERNNSSLLGDTFEAYIGALYLDQGLDCVRNFLQSLLLSVLEELTVSPVLPAQNAFLDVKNQLQQWAQTHYQELPEYFVIEETGPDHAKEFTCGVKIRGQLYGMGHGSRKQDATKAAATQALQKLGLL